MKRIDYLITVKDPVIFAEKSGDNVLFATKKYIPGSAVRGALAASYIDAKIKKAAEAYKNEEFYELFLSGRVKFLPAYPVSSASFSAAMPIVLPLSIMKIKVKELDKPEIVDLASGKKPGAGYKKLTGFALYDKEQAILKKQDTTTKVEFHMSRHEDKERLAGRSIDGKIFNYEYIEPEQCFQGSIIIDDSAAADKLQGLMSNITELRLGRSKYAQYGLCSLNYKEGSLNSELLRKQISEAEENKQKIYLCTLTPYIPFGDWQRADAAAKELLEAIEAACGNGLRLQKQNLSIFSNIENVDGFVGVWKAKKPTEKAVSAGSLFELVKEAGAWDFEKLQECLAKGFGKNTVEGFGQFYVWHPLDEVTFAEGKDAAPLAKQELCDSVKEQAVKIIKNMLLQECHLRAARDVARISFANNNHHIFKRVENDIRKYKAKDRIQNQKDRIQNQLKCYSKIAQDNLRSIVLDEQSIYERLLDKKPLSSNVSAETLSISDEAYFDLQAELGMDIFTLSEDEYYSEYWLWFMRHIVKKGGAEDGESAK